MDNQLEDTLPAEEQQLHQQGQDRLTQEQAYQKDKINIDNSENLHEITRENNTQAQLDQLSFHNLPVNSPDISSIREDSQQILASQKLFAAAGTSSAISATSQSLLSNVSPRFQGQSDLSNNILDPLEPSKRDNPSRWPEICSIHGIRNKYVCIESNCKANSRIACAECHVEGPHPKHELVKSELFQQTITEKAKKALNIFDSINKDQAKRSLCEIMEDLKNQFLSMLEQFREDKLSQLDSANVMGLDIFSNYNDIYFNDANQGISEDCRGTLAKLAGEQEIDFNNKRQVQIALGLFESESNETLDTSQANFSSFVEELTAEINHLKINVLNAFDLKKQIEVMNDKKLKDQQGLEDSGEELDEEEEVQDEEGQQQLAENNSNNRMDNKSTPSDEGRIQRRKQKNEKILTNDLNRQFKNDNSEEENNDINDNNDDSNIPQNQIDYQQQKNIKSSQNAVSASQKIKQNNKNTTPNRSPSENKRSGNLEYDWRERRAREKKQEELNMKQEALQSSLVRKKLQLKIKGVCLKKMTEHKGWIGRIERVSEDIFASCSSDRKVIFWSSTQMKPTQTWQELDTQDINKNPSGLPANRNASAVPKQHILSLCKLDDKYIALGGSDKLIKILDWGSSNIVKKLKGHRGGVNFMILLSEEMLCSCGSDNSIIVWDWKGESIVNQIENHHSMPIYQIATLNSSDLLASCSKDTTVKVYNFQTKQVTAVLTQAKQAVYTVCYLKRTLLAAGSADSTIRIWNYLTQTQMKVIRVAGQSIYSLCKIDDHYIASGSSDNKIKIWAYEEGQNLESSQDSRHGNGALCVKTLEGHMSAVSSLCYFQDKLLLISGSNDHSICIWN